MPFNVLCSRAAVQSTCWFNLTFEEWDDGAVGTEDVTEAGGDELRESPTLTLPSREGR